MTFTPPIGSGAFAHGELVNEISLYTRYGAVIDQNALDIYNLLNRSYAQLSQTTGQALSAATYTQLLFQTVAHSGGVGGLAAGNAGFLVAADGDYELAGGMIVTSAVSTTVLRPTKNGAQAGSQLHVGGIDVGHPGVIVGCVAGDVLGLQGYASTALTLPAGGAWLKVVQLG